jgi:hypothetical protein
MHLLNVLFGQHRLQKLRQDQGVRFVLPRNRPTFHGCDEVLHHVSLIINKKDGSQFALYSAVTAHGTF